jgi:hypothetical protein
MNSTGQGGPGPFGFITQVEFVVPTIDSEFYTKSISSSFDGVYTVTVSGGSGNGTLSFDARLVAAYLNKPLGSSERYRASSSISSPFTQETDTLASEKGCRNCNIQFTYDVPKEVHLVAESRIFYEYETSADPQILKGERIIASITLTGASVIDANLNLVDKARVRWDVTHSSALVNKEEGRVHQESTTLKAG